MIPNLLIGQILAIIVALTYAENSIIYSYLGNKVSVKASVHVRLWIAAPIIILIALLSEGNFFVEATLLNWVVLLLSGFFGYLLCDSLLFWAFTNIGPRETLVIMILNPIFSSILSFFFFKESLSVLQIFAILITITGIVVLILSQNNEIDEAKKRTKPKELYLHFLLQYFKQYQTYYQRVLYPI